MGGGPVSKLACCKPPNTCMTSSGCLASLRAMKVPYSKHSTSHLGRAGGYYFWHRFTILWAVCIEQRLRRLSWQLLAHPPMANQLIATIEQQHLSLPGTHLVLSHTACSGSLRCLQEGELGAVPQLAGQLHVGGGSTSRCGPAGSRRALRCGMLAALARSSARRPVSSFRGSTKAACRAQTDASESVTQHLWDWHSQTSQI